MSNLLDERAPLFPSNSGLPGLFYPTLGFYDDMGRYFTLGARIEVLTRDVDARRGQRLPADKRCVAHRLLDSVAATAARVDADGQRVPRRVAAVIRRLMALRWWMISLITIGTILNYLTRTTLGVAAPTLMGDLGITEKEYSWVTGFFQAGIMLQPVAGYVMDLIGLKLGFGLFALAWSVIMMLHGAASSWPMLAALRGADGSGGRLGAARRHEGGGRVVSGEGARIRRWLLQHRRLVWFDAGGAAGRLGHPVSTAGAGLRDRRRRRRWCGWRRGSASITRPSSIRGSPRRSASYIESGQEAHVAASAAKPSILACSSSATSGASRFRACSPIRPGARCLSGCLST